MTMLAYKECLPPYLQHNSTERYVQKKQLTPAPPRREARTGQEFFLTKDWLHEEVTRERNKNVPEGETPWYHLAGTGFFNKAQVEQLLRNVQGVGKEAFPDVLNLELSKVKVDIESFVDEYLKQMLTLRFNLS